MFVINEWIDRYEVTDKGRPAKAGDDLRLNRLEYIRSKVHGRQRGPGFRKMQAIAGDSTYEVFGIFQKFLEIAADEKRDRRGVLWNEKGKPASIKDLAFILVTTEKKIKNAIVTLSHPTIGWIRKIPGNPGKSGALYNETKRNVIEIKSNQENVTKRNINQEKSNQTSNSKEDSPDKSSN